MAIDLKGTVVCSVDPLLPPSPTLVGLLVFPIHSLVAQSGLEFFAQVIINVITLFPKHYAEIG